ncbi:HTH-type transcriptional repressor YtrA [Clostridium acetireducens DSM 10703]|uniref:HTH-type transcriptional repressor YtrA n=1 Tax=Clostridium acetireducens DSM 10703 TaxID=1121290 RepID=A0A1E8F0U4_9CLOT|nr:GntR family transcriptional regulator [Clostridium acetireducens]OFI07073.1 HTH-type transcriptional repressor YtrA [Clostridium acetireducens DSM 10703]
MNIIISNSSGKAIYQQIVDQIKSNIIKENVEEGEALPSIRNLAKELNISVITTKRAYEELEREGFIQTVPGKGSFIAPQNKELMREKKIKIIEDKLQQVVKSSKLMGVSLEELIQMLKILYEE